MWEARVAPALAGALLVAGLWQILDAFPAFLGVAPDSPLGWILPSVFLVLAVLGIVWALILRAIQPRIYAQIGLGGPAAPADSPRPGTLRAGQGGGVR
jgi:hypothetical protein